MSWLSVMLQLSDFPQIVRMFARLCEPGCRGVVSAHMHPSDDYFVFVQNSLHDHSDANVQFALIGLFVLIVGCVRFAQHVPYEVFIVFVLLYEGSDVYAHFCPLSRAWRAVLGHAGLELLYHGLSGDRELRLACLVC